MSGAPDPLRAKVVVGGSKAASPDALVEVLHEVVRLLRGIRNDFALQRQNRQPAANLLSRADRKLLAKLLPAVGGVLGSEEFLARDLLQHPAPALRLVLRGQSAQRIGLLFDRAEGQVVDGYVIERAGDELHTNLWRVVEVAGTELPSTSPHDPAARA